MKYRVTDADGVEVNDGDVVSDFRGDTWRFAGVERGPMPGKSAKVMVTNGQVTHSYYASVFELTVVEV